MVHHIPGCASRPWALLYNGFAVLSKHWALLYNGLTVLSKHFNRDGSRKGQFTSNRRTRFRAPGVTPYAEGITQHSPGSRSAPWVARTTSARNPKGVLHGPRVNSNTIAHQGYAARYRRRARTRPWSLSMLAAYNRKTQGREAAAARWTVIMRIPARSAQAASGWKFPDHRWFTRRFRRTTGPDPRHRQP